MKKVAINKCYGGFSISPRCIQWIQDKKGEGCYFFDEVLSFGKKQEEHYKSITLKGAEECGPFFSAYSVPDPWNHKYSDASLDKYTDNREDPILIEAIEQLGEGADGSCASLKIVEIPDDVEYIIEEYDGMEHISEVHRTWE